MRLIHDKATKVAYKTDLLQRKCYILLHSVLRSKYCLLSVLKWLENNSAYVAQISSTEAQTKRKANEKQIQTTSFISYKFCSILKTKNCLGQPLKTF